MATRPPENNVFLQEVDDALRQETLADFWRRYGRWMLAVAIAGLVAFGSYLFWQSRQGAARGADGEAFHALMEKIQAGPNAEADKELARLAKDGTPAYRAMAIIQQSNQKAADGDRKAAAALLAWLAKDDTVDKSLRDLALIRQTALEFDTLEPAAVIARMAPIVSPTDPVSAFFPGAAELTAIAHYQAGRFKEAGELFARIARHEGVSDSLKSRTGQMAGMLGVDALNGNDNNGDAGGDGVAPAADKGKTE